WRSDAVQNSLSTRSQRSVSGLALFSFRVFADIVSSHVSVLAVGSTQPSAIRHQQCVVQAPRILFHRLFHSRGYPGLLDRSKRIAKFVGVLLITNILRHSQYLTLRE